MSRATSVGGEPPAGWRERVTRWSPVLVPALVATALLAAGHPARATVVGAFAVIVAVLVALGVPVADGVGRAALAVAGALGNLVLGLVFVVVFVPSWVLDRLRGGRSLDRVRGWRAAPGLGPAPRGPGAARRPRMGQRFAAVVGTVVLLVGLDYGIGWAWDTARSEGSSPSAGVAVGRRPSSTVTVDAGADGGGAADPRAALPAMASSPWAAEYFRDLSEQAFVPWPLIGVKPVDLTSRYVNVKDWVRRSWEAPGAEERPTIWFFGGSGMFGEGQRDDHTIASEVARLAAADGIPVTVSNHGQRGWVHWQEMLLFEQRLAQVGSPDLAVFYDGPNEITAAQRFGDGVPETLDGLPGGDGGAVTGPAELATQVLGPEDPGLVRAAWDAYAEHSALRKVVRWLGFGAEPASAQEADGGTADDPVAEVPTTGPSDPSGRQERPSEVFAGEDIARIAIGTYRRGRDLTDHIAEEHGVAVRHFLQPQYYDDLSTWTYVQSRWPQPTVDLTDSVAARRDEVFIDGVHTNELGAELVAQAMWAALRPDVERWYATHP